MRKIIIFSAFILLILTSNAMSQEYRLPFKIKKYFHVSLNAASNAPKLDSAEAFKVQQGHLDHLASLMKEGKCKLAGPFGDAGETLGIMIMDVATEEEVKEICGRDPAVIAGVFDFVIRPWFGPENIEAGDK